MPWEKMRPDFLSNLIEEKKRDVTNCRVYRGVRLLKDRMKVVEKVLEKGIRALAVVDDMQFGFMPRRGMTDAFFIVRRLQEEYRKKDKKILAQMVGAFMQPGP